MKAIQLQAPGGLERLKLSELPDPGQPGPGEILVRIRASSLNYHDYLVANGSIPAADGRIPMSDGAGEVLAVGDGVAEFAAGDQVVSTFFPDWLEGAAADNSLGRVPGDSADGYARELVRAKASDFTRAPRGWDPVESATVTCAGVTAWRALVLDGGLTAGETVLVQGAGGVSVLALQIAKAAGCTVIATSSSDEKLERLKALGADHLINYRAEPKWGSAVRRLTDGRGVDHVVEIGGPGTLPQSITACRVGGHIALIGVLTGRAGEMPTGALMGRQQRLVGLMVGSRRHQLDFIRAIEASGLRPVIDSRYPMAELAEAFRRQESGAHFSKIAVEI